MNENSKPFECHVLRGFACVLYTSTPYASSSKNNAFQGVIGFDLQSHLRFRCSSYNIYISYQNEVTLEVNPQFHVLNHWHLVVNLWRLWSKLKRRRALLPSLSSLIEALCRELRMRFCSKFSYLFWFTPLCCRGPAT